MPNSKSDQIIKKETRFSHKGIIEFKESDDDLIVKGYIATTHFDGQDKLKVEALYKWADEINDGIPRANKASVNHKRDPHVAGKGIEGTAKVEQFYDGEYGLFVETIVDKTREDYSDIKYRVDKGFLDSFSIEYYPPEDPEINDGVRILDETTELHGWTLASQPMNEHAVMIKELINSPKRDDKDNKVKIEYKEETKMSEEPKEITISEKELALLEKAKQMQFKEQRLEELKELLKDESFQNEIKEMLPKDKPLMNKEEEVKPEETTEEKEAKKISIEYKETISRKDLDLKEKFRRVGMIAEKKGMVWAEGVDKLGFKTSKVLEGKDNGFKNFSVNGTKMEFKGLGITTNQNSDTDYLLSAAELRDMFDPVIYDALNLSTTTWGLLNKDDYSNKGNNQVQFKMKITENASTAFYTNNAVNTSQTGRIKYMTKFKKLQSGVEVDGDMIAAARGGPVGDVFGLEVADATESLVSKANSQLFGEKGLETAAEPIGFEYITDATGNATLYNVTRSSDNALKPATATDTYINGSSAIIALVNLRNAIKQAKLKGANVGNLMFVTNPVQGVLFKGKYDSAQRMPGVAESLRPGFEGMLAFDSVPIFEDKDCATDDWWLIDRESHRVAIWVPPTLEMLGKSADSEEGFIKMYYAVYNTVPLRMVQIYGNATS